MVKQLVEMHGGSVTAQQRGRTAKALVVDIHAAAASRRRSAPPARYRFVPRASARRVLIVDDNIDAADSLAMLLKLDGHDAESVYDSSIALQRVGEFDPEVILLDIGLPVMDGYEVARRAARDRQQGAPRRADRLRAGERRPSGRARPASTRIW